MSKKKSGVNLWYCTAAVLALVAILMMFVTNINIVGKLSNEVHYACNGLQTVFGYKDGNLEVYSFSFMNLLAYLLVIAGLVLVLLKLANASNSNIVDILAICVLLVGGVLFFLMPSLAVCPYASSLVTLQLGIGAIIGGVLAILGAVVVALKLVLKK